jgi:uncharacterized protein
LDLATQVNEPLTGRMIDFYLYPLSAQEIYHHDSSLWLKNRQRYMIYGLYPSIYDQPNIVIEDKIKILASNYLYKDILEFEFIRKSEVLIKLLQLLALQI